MKRFRVLPLAAAIAAFASQGAGATTVIGDLGNFDTLNDTGGFCYGFEIEIDGVHSTDISYTFDWNHYGTPKIREDNSGPTPKVFVRYESTPDASGNWGANNSVTNTPSFTNQASPTNSPPQGHTCTDTSVNEGCEHFGVGFNTTPTNIVYNWLVDGGAGTLVPFGTPVKVAAPTWNYTPPAGGQPAQVVAVIPAPVVPIPDNPNGLPQFGEPVWVKVIKTTSQNPNPVALKDLVSDDDPDPAHAGMAKWQNGEPDTVETEWKLLQRNNDPDVNPQDELAGAVVEIGDVSENVTRRYEFYEYVRYVKGVDPATPVADSLDGETREAMCDEVDPNSDPNDPTSWIGVNANRAVTDPNGDTYYVDCTAQVVVGKYIGAQMAGFDADAPLGLIDHLQDGEMGTPYVNRTVVIGGNVPYTTINVTGLPNGLSLSGSGVLSGTPTESGDFNVTVEATDGSDVSASKTYALHIVGSAVPQHQLSVDATGPGGVSGNGIDCSANTGTCSMTLNDGTAVALSATPGTDAVFNGWTGGYCSGTGTCSFSLTEDSNVGATFTQQYRLSVATSGGGTGTVTGSGINCPSTCSIMLDKDAPVALVAAATNGSFFIGWSGDCTGTGTCDTTMSAARSVTAAFVPSTTMYSLTVQTTGSGTVTSSPKVKGSINCGNKCSGSFPVGQSVTLTATPKNKHSFSGWSGDCGGTSLTCTLPMLGGQSVSANFN